MLKRPSLAAALTLAALVAVPAASQANHRPLDRLDRHVTRAVHDVDRTLHQIGKEIRRAGDHLFGWLRRDRHRA